MRGGLVLTLLVAGAAQAGEARLTDASIRAFVARQDAAWNARDARAFAATFTPDAIFVAQARGSDGRLTANGRSTLDQATAQARRFFARNRFTQTGAVDRVIVAPDGRSAEVLGHQVTRIEASGATPRTFCAETRQTLVLAPGRILSRGQTETDVRCRR